VQRRDAAVSVMSTSRTLDVYVQIESALAMAGTAQAAAPVTATPRAIR
jgi:hypothetical protein